MIRWCRPVHTRREVMLSRAVRSCTTRSPFAATRSRTPIPRGCAYLHEASNRGPLATRGQAIDSPVILRLEGVLDFPSPPGRRTKRRVRRDGDARDPRCTGASSDDFWAMTSATLNMVEGDERRASGRGSSCFALAGLREVLRRRRFGRGMLHPRVTKVTITAPHAYFGDCGCPNGRVRPGCDNGVSGRRRLRDMRRAFRRPADTP